MRPASAVCYRFRARNPGAFIPVTRLLPTCLTIVAAAAVVVVVVGTPARAKTPLVAPPQPAEVAPAAPTASADPEPDAEVVAWEALVTEIERTSPLMDAARAGLDAFETKLSRAEWAYFPTFQLDAGAFPTPTVTGTSVDWSHWGYYYRFKGRMVQPIYTFGRIAALKEAARSGIDVGRAQVEAARWELRHRAAQAYFGAILARELDALFADGERWLDKARQRMERLRDEDSDDYDQLEHLRLETRVSEFYQLEADNRLVRTTADEGLRLLLSRPTGHRVAPPAGPLEPLEFALEDVAVYVTAGRSHQPTVRMAEAGWRAKDALADHTFAELWPNLVLLGELGFSDSDVINKNSTVLGSEVLGPTGGVLLGLRWELDVPQRVLRLDEARAQARQARGEALVAQDLMELEVRRLHQQLADKRQLLERVERSTKAAQGWLNATWDVYDAGFGDFKDVMDALVQYYSKKVGYLRLVHEYNVLIFGLGRAIGVDPRHLAAEAPPAGKEQTPE